MILQKKEAAACSFFLRFLSGPLQSGFFLSHRLMPQDAAIPAAASTPIMTQVERKEPVRSNSAPAMVLPKDAAIRFVLITEKFIG